jgi:hypothetical protein
MPIGTGRRGRQGFQSINPSRVAGGTFLGSARCLKIAASWQLRAACRSGPKGEIAMRLIYLTMSAGLCVVPLCAWAAVSFYDNETLQPLAVSAGEPSAKGDRTQRPFNVALPPNVSVEISGQSTSVITLRDGDGSFLYQVDSVNRTTIIAKRTERTGPIPATARDAISQPVIALPLPDGCESAFSHYAAPNRAHVIGRCIS